MKWTHKTIHTKNVNTNQLGKKKKILTTWKNKKKIKLRNLSLSSGSTEPFSLLLFKTVEKLKWTRQTYTFATKLQSRIPNATREPNIWWPISLNPSQETNPIKAIKFEGLFNESVKNHSSKTTSWRNQPPYKAMKLRAYLMNLSRTTATEQQAQESNFSESL